MQRVKRWMRARRLGCRDPPPPASLDGLPTELKQVIMEQLPDIQTLSALVHASARYYRAYRDRRLPVLQSVLWRELEHDVVNVMAAVEASELSVTDPDRVRVVRNFLLDHDRKRQMAKDPTSSVRSLRTFRTWSSTADRVAMVLRLRAAISYLTGDFCLWIAQASLPYSMRTCRKQPLEPSTTERQRMQRAFYRLEILRCLFGPTEATVGLDLEAARFLTVILRGWESEELACVCDYTEDRWTQLFESLHTVSSGVDWDPELAMSPKERSARDAEERSYKQHLTSLGPCMLDHALRFKKYKSSPESGCRQFEKIVATAMITADRTTKQRVVLHAKLYWETISIPYTLHTALISQAPSDFNLGYRRRIGPLPSIKFDQNDHWYESSAAWIWATECSDNDKRFDNRFHGSVFRRNALVMWDDDRLKAWMASTSLKTLTYLNRTRQIGIRAVLRRGYCYIEVDNPS